MPYLCSTCLPSKGIRHVNPCKAQRCECKCHDDWKFRVKKREYLDRLSKLPKETEALPLDVKPTTQEKRSKLDWWLAALVLCTVVQIVLQVSKWF